MTLRGQPKPGPDGTRSWKRALLNVAMAVTFTTLLLEGVVRLVYASPSISVPDARMGRMWRPHAYYFQAQEGRSAIITNDIGLNDIDVARVGERGVLVLGDSYAEALQLPRESNGISLFRARHPQIPILNAGRRGLSLLHFPTMLEHVRPHYRPDMIVAVVTHYTLAPLRTRNFTLERDRQGKLVRVNVPPLWTGEGRLARTGYWLAGHSALVQFLLFKYQDRIKQFFNLGVGVAGNQQVQADAAGLASLAEPDFADIAAYIFAELKKAAPLRVVFIPDVEYRAGARAEIPLFSRQAQAVFTEAAAREKVPLISIGPDMIAEFTRTGRISHGFHNGVPGEGHINQLGHQLLGKALETSILAVRDGP